MRVEAAAINFMLLRREDGGLIKAKTVNSFLYLSNSCYIFAKAIGSFGEFAGYVRRRGHYMYPQRLRASVEGKSSMQSQPQYKLHVYFATIWLRALRLLALLTSSHCSTVPPDTGRGTGRGK